MSAQRRSPPAVANEAHKPAAGFRRPRMMSRSSAASPTSSGKAGSPSASSAGRTGAGAARHAGARASPNSSATRLPPARQPGARSPVSSDDDEAFARASKEELLAVIRNSKQEKEDLDTALNTANVSLEETSADNAQLADSLESVRKESENLFNERQRLDQDLAGLQEDLEGTKSRLKDCERVKKDLEKRSKDDNEAFDRERSVWMEAEKKLHDRIAATQAQQPFNVEIESLPPHSRGSSAGEAPDTEPTPTRTSAPPLQVAPIEPEPINPNPELVATLAQLQSDHEQLQIQHAELVTQSEKSSEEVQQLQLTNTSLMDENESFQLLLGERTLSGEILGQGVLGASWDASPPTSSPENHRPRPSPRRANSLEGVAEEGDEFYETHGDGDASAGAVGARGVQKRKPVKKPKAPTVGLDLAAELGRAEEEEDQEDEEQRARNTSGGSHSEWATERLVAEIKALKDANKALSLYINRIIERVIAHEGFEKVLAADYAAANAPPKNEQPLSSSTNSERSSMFSPLSSSVGSSTAATSSAPSDTTTKHNKRSSARLSISGIASTLFGSGSSAPKPAAPEQPKLKPILLGQQQSGASSPSLRGSSSSPTSSFPTTREGADELEDAELARERERVNAELASMGINEEPGSPGLRQAQRNSISQSIENSFDSTEVAEPRQTQSAVPLAAIDQMSSINERDKQSLNELKSGRASGFTEPRRKSVRRPRRDGSRSSAQSVSQMGDPPEFSRSGSSSSTQSPDPNNDQANQGWGAKLLRRVSVSR